MMIKAIVVFTAAFGLCAALGSTGTGCSTEVQPECQTPNRPPALSGLHFDWVTTEGDAAPTIRPIGGTLESKGDTMVIRYRDANDVRHEIVYAIDGPWSPF